MTDRDADLAMLGFILGAALFVVALASSCVHVPRGPTSCCEVGL